MPHPVVHFEIGCRDADKSQAFYSKLFDWKFQAFGNARMLDTGVKEGPSINGHLNALGHEPHNYCLIYVHVDNIEAHCKKAESLGAKVLIPKQEVPNLGHFAWLKDPEGTVFGLWKPMNMA